MSTSIPESPQIRKSRVLLVDDDESEFFLVSELLKDKQSVYELKWVDTLAKGIECLKEKFDVVLLDLFLGDSRGLDTFKQMKSHVTDIPIVILSGLDDEGAAIEAIQLGAQDFLVKDAIGGNRLSRVIQYAIKRNEIKKNPENAGLIDSLTGLYNRQGFAIMAAQHLKAAQRAKSEFFVCFVVLHELALIREAYGKSEGDHAILTASEILRESFRSSDLIAKMGDDEFGIFTTDQGNYSPKVISTRIKKNQKYYNSQFNRYRLSLSICAIHFAPSEQLSVKDLMSKSDQVFSDYKTKKGTESFIETN